MENGESERDADFIEQYKNLLTRFEKIPVKINPDQLLNSVDNISTYLQSLKNDSIA